MSSVHHTTRLAAALWYVNSSSYSYNSSYAWFLALRNIVKIFSKITRVPQNYASAVLLSPV